MTRVNERPHLITHRNHPAVRRIRDLRLRAERDRTGLYFAEGIRFLAQALQHGARLESLIACRELLTNPLGRKLVGQARRAGLTVLDVTPEVFHSLAMLDEPQGIAAVLRQRWEPLDRLAPDAGLCWIALSAVQSPGNLGTILRTADAAGAAGVIVIGDRVDPFEPAAVRATMGAIFSQRFARATLAELAAWKARHGCPVVGAAPAAPTDYRAANFRKPVVLFMGWERQGLTADERALCDLLVRIPMVGQSDSLNLAVATGILLYEIFNQRRG